MDQYRIALPNGRSQALAAEQLRRIAQGLGDPFDAPPGNGRPSPIIRALHSLPIERRAEALAVALLRFGEKQDIETIARSRGLSPWDVWQLEEAFRRGLADGREGHLDSNASGSIESDPEGEVERSPTARLMRPELLANAVAHGERVDLDREHEASLER